MPDTRRTHDANPLLHDQLMALNTQRTPEELLVYRELNPMGYPDRVTDPDFPNGTIIAPQDNPSAQPQAAQPIGAPQQGMDFGVAQGMSPIPSQAPQEGGLSFGDSLAMRLMNGAAVGTGHLPAYLQAQLAQQEMMTKQGTLEAKRAEMAQKLAAAEQEKKNQFWEQTFKVIGNEKFTSPQQIELLKKLGKGGNPVAADMTGVVNDKMLADYKLVQDRLGISPEEIMQGVSNGDFNWHDIAARVTVEKKNLVQEAETMAHENAQRKQHDTLETKFREDPNSLSDGELETLSKIRDAAKQRQITIQNLQNTGEEQRQTIDQRKVMNPLEAQKQRQDIRRGNAPIVSPSFIGPGGEQKNIITDPRSNSQREVGGVPFTKTQNVMPTTMLKERADTMASISTLRDIASKFHPDFVGTGDSAWNSIKRALGAETKRKVVDASGKERVVSEADFRTGYDSVIKILRKELMGTAQAVHELSANPLAFPSASDMDADTTIPHFFQNQFQSLVRKLEAQTGVMAEQRRQNPVPAQTRAQQLMDMAQAIDVNGKNALGFKSKDEMKQAIAERLAEEIRNGWVTQ